MNGLLERLIAADHRDGADGVAAVDADQLDLIAAALALEPASSGHHSVAARSALQPQSNLERLPAAAEIDSAARWQAETDLWCGRRSVRWGNGFAPAAP